MMNRGPTFPLRFLVFALAAMALIGMAHGGINIDVTGNHFLGNRKIKETVPLDPKKYTEETLNTWKEDAVFQVTDLYRQNGFFDIRMDLNLIGGKDPEDWKAKIAIEEGKRYVFDTVRVVVVRDTSRPSPKDSLTVGIDTARVDTLKLAPPQPVPQPALVVGPKELDARTGKPYREELLFRDRRTVLRKYGNSGFVRAKIDDKVSVKSDTKSVKVDYLVEPSYPVIYDTLLIRDLRAPPEDTLQGITRNSLFASLVPYDKGDTVRVDQNDRLIEKLQYTGAFNFVRVKDSLLPGPAHRSALVLFSEEHVPGTWRSSVFWESQYGPGVSLDAAHNNVAGTLNQVRSGGSLAMDRQRAYAGYGSALTFGYMIRFDDDLDFNWFQAPPVPDAQGMFGGDFRGTNSTRLTWPWHYWLRLIGDAELEAKSRTVDAGRERSMNLNFIQTAALSFLNQPMDPTRGVRTSFIWGNGGPFIENNELAFTRFRHNWLEVQSSYYYYYPPARQVKLALRLDGGRFFQEGGTNSDRFFLGGSRSVRSYGYQRLCPDVDSAGFCATQNLQPAYFLTSYELRLGLFDLGYLDPRGPMRHLIPLEVVPFYDYGKVWDVRETFSFSSQTHGQGHAYGIGLRYPLLGIFNFRLDLAYGAPGNGSWPDAWVIDLAQAF